MNFWNALNEVDPKGYYPLCAQCGTKVPMCEVRLCESSNDYEAFIACHGATETRFLGPYNAHARILLEVQRPAFANALP